MFLALPQTIRDRITEWTTSLSALGNDLVAILLTGGVARGDFRPGESDVNALVVLSDASFAEARRDLERDAGRPPMARGSRRRSSPQTRCPGSWTRSRSLSDEIAAIAHPLVGRIRS